MSKVIVVAHPETGNVITPRKKEGYSSFRVDSETISMEGGFVNRQKRTAFIGGKTEDLEALGLKAGQELSGIIQRQLSKEPFYDGQEEVMNPETGETKGYYQNYVFTSDVNAPETKWIEPEVSVGSAAKVEEIEDVE